MADLADVANDFIEAERRRGLRLVRANLRADQPVTNTCRNCYEETVGRNFCNVGCRDDFEVRQKNLLIRGTGVCNVTVCS
jgi:hypothetical protein